MNNQEPRSRPIKDNRTINSLFPTRFIKAAQLLAWMVTEVVVTISRIQEEEVSPKPNQTEWKPVIYFKTKTNGEYARGYLLSAKVDAESLTAATGAQTVEELVGKKIRIKLAEFRGKSVLRIDPKPVSDPDEPKREEPVEDDYPHSPPWPDEDYTEKDHID